MTNLILDQGNTRLKSALYDNGELIRLLISTHYSDAPFQKLLAELNPDAVMVSSVTHDDLYQQMKLKYGEKVFQLSHESPLPFTSHYSTPETLGLDRIALAAAAVGEFPKRNCLIIDAGTCITYDFIDENKVYHGGAIGPGLMMRYRALNDYTSRLPLVEHQAPMDLIGHSTAESIRSGVVHGMIAEIEGTIARYDQRFNDLQVIITGGDAQVFEPLVKNGIFAAPNFLLTGLNNILEHYAEVL